LPKAIDDLAEQLTSNQAHSSEGARHGAENARLKAVLAVAKAIMESRES